MSYTPTQLDFNSGSNNGTALRHEWRPGRVDGGMDAKNIVEGAAVYDGEPRRRRLDRLAGRPLGELRTTARRRRRRRLVRRLGWRQRSICSASSSAAASAPRSGDAERDFFNAGIGARLGPVNVSVTYGQIFDSDIDFVESTGIGDCL